MIARLLLVLAALAFTGSAYAQTWLNRIQAKAAPTNQFMTGVNTAGLPIFAQPTAANISGLGTAATKNTGTSGNTVPLLDGANAWSQQQNFSAAKPISASSASTNSPQLEAVNSAPDASAGYLMFRKNRGSTVASANGDSLGMVRGYGYDGAAWQVGATLEFRQATGPADADLVYANAFTEKFRFTSSGVRAAAGSYYNWGGTSGPTGYGWWDDAGVMKAKNSGGSWYEVNTKAPVADSTIRSNISGASAAPSDNTISAVLDKQFGSTRGTIAYRGATGWSSLTPGTAGYALTTNGAGADPSWSGASNSSRVLLATLTASNSATLASTTALSGGYANFEIVFENLVRATASTNCKIQIYSGGAYQTTGYLSYAYALTSGGSAATEVTDGIPCDNSQSNASASVPLSGMIRVSNTAQTTGPKQFHGQMINASTATLSTQVAGYWNGGNGAIGGLQVFFSSGNITSGSIRVYGLN